MINMSNNTKISDIHRGIIPYVILLPWKNVDPRFEFVGGIPEVREPEKCEGWKWFILGRLPWPLFPPIGTLILQGFDPFNLPNITMGNADFPTTE